MRRRQFLALLAAGASLAVPPKGLGNIIDGSTSFSNEKNPKNANEAQQLAFMTEPAQSLPTKILDLHSHMFNCRYFPLESIIYDWLKSHTIAEIVAQLLYRMTGSSYTTPPSRHAILQELKQKTSQSGGVTTSEEVDDIYIDEMWQMARYELLLTTNDQNLIYRLKKGEIEPTNWADQAKETYPDLINSDLFTLISQLEMVQYKNEWETAIPNSKLSPPPMTLKTTKSILDLLNVAGYLFKRALWIFVKLVMPKFWSETVHSYAEAFFILLASEEQLLDRFLKTYGDGLPPIQTVHYMMDMQMAYPGKTLPFYDFSTVQLDRMQTLWRRHAETLIGFSAFDPRRSNWLDLATKSRKQGFKGFKFYPSMGYRPYGDKDKVTRNRINEFFDWCVLGDVPIFSHCTPKGFETSKREGSNAHPILWGKVLQTRKTLRLCLGHAGGGRMGKSAGWLATEDKEWATDDNYAYVVVKLCTTYPNVYCDMAYITTLLAEDRHSFDIFLRNLERAKEIKGEYDFMKKIAYGSDWHMPEMAMNARRYLDVWLKIFSLPYYEGYREQFFWQNGKAYLNI